MKATGTTESLGIEESESVEYWDRCSQAWWKRADTADDRGDLTERAYWVEMADNANLMICVLAYPQVQLDYWVH
jgi:hypothetical protein